MTEHRDVSPASQLSVPVAASAKATSQCSISSGQHSLPAVAALAGRLLRQVALM